MTRREFCTECLKLMAAGTLLPSLAARSVFAQAAPGAPKHLVVIQLFGGNDGLNTLVPLRNPLYQRYRPMIAVPAAQCIALNPDYGLNPALESIAPFWEAGHLAVVQGVGHPLSDRSHFTSTSIWETAQLGSSPDAGTGWLGRYLDSLARPATAPSAGLTVSIDIPQTFTARSASVSAVNDLDTFRLETDPAHPEDRELLLSTLRAILAQSPAESADQGYIRQTGTGTLRDVDLYRNVNAAYRAAVTYPASDIAKRLQIIAKMITEDAPPRVHLAMQDTYDQHADLPAQHPKLLQDLADALSAFSRDLKAQGRYDDVTIFTFSEFGRRVKENQSQGTDHGHGSVLFVMGGAVRGGLYGTYPSLEPEDLIDGDLRQTVDFRQVYATILDRWMGADADSLLGGKFDRLGFL